ncbi:MAG: hypothetical protein ACR2FK_06310, partial [Sphingomicrobium sp.]
TYPRTRALIGEDAFHEIAEQHLADPARMRLPHAQIGIGFANRLTGPAFDLATTEWAWLNAHGAADADPFDLATITGLTAQCVASATVMRHPAARLVARTDPTPFDWNGVIMDSPLILLTRPYADVCMTGAGQSVAALLNLLDRPSPFASLLEIDNAAATLLVTAGALALYPGIML